MNRRDFLARSALGGAVVLSGIRPARAADRYAPFKGQTIVVNVPAHPHYDVAMKLVPEFTRATGIKVELDRMQYLRMKDKQLLEMSKSKGDYDVIAYVVMWKTEYVKKGLLTELEPLMANKELADPTYDSKDLVPGYYENIGLVGGKKGYLPGPGAKLYGIPFGAETSVLAYRKDIFEKHGLTPPATYGEMMRTARIIKEKEPGMGGLTSRGQSGHQVTHAWLLHFNPLGGKVFGDDWQPLFNQAEGVKALATLKEIVDTGPAGIPSFGFGEMMNAFLLGQSAMYLDTIAVFGQVNDPKKSQVAGKVGYALHPKGVRHSSQTGGFGLGIPANSAKKEAAYLFIEWMTSKMQDVALARMGANASRMSTLEDPEVKAQFPEYELLKRQLAYADPDWRPIIPEWDQISSQVLGVHLSEALTGQRSPEDALAACLPKVSEIMRKGGYV